MYRIRFCAVALLSALVAVPCGASGADRLVTLEEAILLAVSRGHDVLSARLEPAAAEAAYRSARGIYDPGVFLQGEYQDRSLPGSGIDTSQVDSRSVAFSGGVSQLLPSGGTISASLTSTRTRTGPTVGLNPSWDSAVSLSLSQPLLRNVGVEPTELTIRVARETSRGSMEQFKAHLMDTVLQVTTEYYRLMNLREEMEVRRSSLSLAEKILADTQGRVAAGVLPAMEILNAEYGKALREKELIDTERSLADHRDVLSYLMQLDESFAVSPISVLSDSASQGDVEGEVLDSALLQRPEILEQEIAVSSLELQERVARNRTLPDLSFTAGLDLTGFSGSYGRSAEQVTGADYPSWNTGLRLTYPLGNETAVNEHARLRTRLEQARIRLDGMRKLVVNEVRAAWREVSSGLKQLEVAERGRSYAEERFRAFQKKHEVGLATTRELLDVEQELALARNTRIAASTGLAAARQKLWRATGELLERNGVEVAEDVGSQQLDQYR